MLPSAQSVEGVRCHCPSSFCLLRAALASPLLWSMRHQDGAGLHDKGHFGELPLKKPARNDDVKAPLASPPAGHTERRFESKFLPMVHRGTGLPDLARVGYA